MGSAFAAARLHAALQTCTKFLMSDHLSLGTPLWWMPDIFDLVWLHSFHVVWAQGRMLVDKNLEFIAHTKIEGGG